MIRGVARLAVRVRRYRCTGCGRHRDHSTSPRTGPARLPDVVEGRSKRVFTSWLQAQTAQFRNGIEVVAMVGFTGFKAAAGDELPDAVAVMGPFPVVAPASGAVDRCRQRVQQDTRGHRGRTGDPLETAAG